MAIDQVRDAMVGAIQQVRSTPQLYEHFVSQNASSVLQIESALRSLTYIIPGRFRESEIASESLHSSVQLLSLYHDSLLARAVARLPNSVSRPLPSLHNKYTRFWTAKSPLYRRIALVLQTVQYTELLWEMAAKRKGEEIRWRVVVVLEMLKACCRLIMTRLTKSRPLVTPPLPERETEFPVAPEDVENTHWNGMATPPFGDASPLDWVMPRTGLSLPTLPDSSEVTEYLLKKVLTADDIKRPEQLLHRMKTYRSYVAEVMWILRPVVYALAMQKFQGDKRSWTPWIIGVSVEIAARQLAKKDLAERLAGGLQGLTGLEREEMRKRGWGMAWWMMRGAFYENITRKGIQAVANNLRGKPLLEMIGGIAEDYQYLWDEYYFSTATM